MFQDRTERGGGDTTPSTPVDAPGATEQERVRTVRWEDPTRWLSRLPTMSGLEYLRAIAAGDIPGAPIAAHMNFGLTEVEEGAVTFTCRPDESHSNPIGAVHGGLVCTLLDSALGCAAQTTLPVGMGYTSIDLSVSYLRPVRADGSLLTCTGRVVKPGRRVAFAEGDVRDEAGRVVATGTSSLLVFPLSDG